MVEWLRPSELARATRVSTSRLRHYEKLGVLPRAGRASNGYRRYPREAATRVEVVRAALELGFTLRELSEVLTSKDRGGRPCRKVRALADEKLLAIDAQIRALRQLRSKLTALTEDWDARLEVTPADERANLLETLDERKNSHDALDARSVSHARFPGKARAAPARSRHDAPRPVRGTRGS